MIIYKKIKAWLCKELISSRKYRTKIEEKLPLLVQTKPPYFLQCLFSTGKRYPSSKETRLLGGSDDLVRCKPLFPRPGQTSPHSTHHARPIHDNSNRCYSQGAVKRGWVNQGIGKIWLGMKRRSTARKARGMSSNKWGLTKVKGIPDGEKEMRLRSLVGK